MFEHNISLEYMGNTFKDIVFFQKKWDIYQINSKNCDKIYIGKTKRELETGVKQHFRNTKNGDIEKSAVAAHVGKKKHAMVHKLVLLKQASKKQELTNCENILITKNKDCIINLYCVTNQFL